MDRAFFSLVALHFPETPRERSHWHGGGLHVRTSNGHVMTVKTVRQFNVTAFMCRDVSISLLPRFAIVRIRLQKVHSDNVEIIEFSFVIYDAKETVCSPCRQSISCKYCDGIQAQRMVLEGQHYCKNSRTPQRVVWTFFTDAVRHYTTSCHEARYSRPHHVKISACSLLEELGLED